MIEKYNFHWREEFFYNFPKTREMFHKLIKEINTKQVISVIGLRRTGKTTLLKQIIDLLIKRYKIKREHLLFYSFDEEQPKLSEIIKEYESVLGKEIFDSKNKFYILLDEIQKLENWQNQIKYYYDNYKNIKFFISGSSSLFLKKSSQESLAGRIYEFVLYPLNFREFLLFRNKEEIIRKTKMFEETIKKEFLAYQKRQFIEIIEEPEEKVRQYMGSIVEKIIYQDIPKVFSVENQELLLKILKVIASNPGLLSDYETLAKELGTNRITLSNYFFYLEESFLVKKLYNFSNNFISSEKKMKKFYLNSTSVFFALNEKIEESKLIENLVILFVNAKFFWRTPQKYEVDIILEKENEIIPVEIKYKNIVNDKDLKNIIKFCEKFKKNKAFIITKDEEYEKIIKLGNRKIKIIFIPAWKFLLEAKI